MCGRNVDLIGFAFPRVSVPVGENALYGFAKTVLRAVALLALLKVGRSAPQVNNGMLATANLSKLFQRNGRNRLN